MVRGNRIEIRKDPRDGKWYWYLDQCSNPQGPIAKSGFGYASKKRAVDRLKLALNILGCQANTVPIYEVDPKAREFSPDRYRQIHL